MAKTLHPTKMKNLADYERSTYHVVLNDPSITLDDVLTPSFWQHHATNISIHSLIDVIGDGFDVQLRAVEKGIGYVKMRVLRKWEDRAVKASHPDQDDGVPDGYTVDHHSKTGWRVRLKNDGTEIGRQFTSRDLAVAKAVEHHAHASGQQAAA